MKFTRDQLIAALGFGVLAVVIGLGGLLLAVLPQRSRARQLDTEIAAAQAKLVSLERKGHSGPAIRAAQLFQLARAMPNTADMPSIVNDLSSAAAASKVTILLIQPQSSVIQTDGSVGLPLQVNVTGNWNGIAAFLRALRAEVRVDGPKLSVNGRLFTIDSVALATGASVQTPTPPVGAPPSGELLATLKLNAFSYGVPAPPAAATGTTSTGTTTTTPGSSSAAGSTG